jgi:hypothetical protein
MIRLARWKLRLLWRAYTRKPRIAAVLGSLCVLAAAGWVGLLAYGSSQYYNWVEAGMPGAPAGLASLAAGMTVPLLASIYLMALIGCLFSALGSAFFVMYSSSDLARLFVAPLTVNQVFSLKLLEVMVPQSLWVLLLVLPLTLGYGAGAGASWTFYPTALYLGLLTLFLPVALGTLINLVALRLIPAHRVREIGGFAGMLFAAITFATIELGSRYAARMDPERWAEVAQMLRLSEAGLSPAWWLARATYAAGRGHAGAALSWSLLTTVVSLLVLGSAFLLVREAFYGGWVGSGEVWKRKSHRTIRAASSHVPHRVPVIAVALKELRVIARTPQNWAGSLHLVVVVLVGFVVPAVMPGGSAAGWREGPLRLYLTMGILGLCHAALALQMSMGMLWREGRAWLLLRTTPLAGLDIVWGKILGASALAIAPGILLIPIIGLLMQARGWEYLALAGTSLVATPGMVALNLAAGALFSRVGLRSIGKQEVEEGVSGWSLVTGSVLSLAHLWLLGGAAVLSTAPLAVAAWARVLGFLALAGFGVGVVMAPAVLTGNLIDAGEAACGS